MIRDFSLSETSEYVGGRLEGVDAYFASVSTDSRAVMGGEIYVALKGEQFDGHGFVDSAIESGAIAAMVEKVEGAISVPHLIVADTLKAYGLLGQMNRRAFAGKVFGITGSSGKTSTKNMLSAVLGQAGNTWATPSNFNNEIGVPQTLLNISAEHEYAVIELGARHPGDIGYIGGLAEPDVAILLNAGQSHIEIFGSYQNIVATKGEIYKTVRTGGVRVLNLDDPAAATWMQDNPGVEFVTYSLNQGSANVSAEILNADAEKTEFMLHTNLPTDDGLQIAMRINLHVPGLHNVSNALAAAAAAMAVGISIADVKNGLESLGATPGRLSQVTTRSGVNIIDDSYNANPASVKAALDVLVLNQGRTVAVLGTMGELGDCAESMHKEVAAYASGLGVDLAYFVGEFNEIMCETFGDGARGFAEKTEAITSLKQLLQAGDTILVKGSRFMRMEDIVNALKDGMQ